MYVALTRARRRLYLTFAQSRMLHGQTRYNVASRFLQEIPPALMKRVHSARLASWRAQEKTPATGYAAKMGADMRGRQGTGAAYELPAASPWRIGQNVVHAKFGAGVIVNAEGRGTDARVQVNFSGAGMKWLAIEYANLSRE